MEKEKKVWLIEQYAHKAWTVSLVLAQEAARAGQYGKGYAVVAHEARTFANKMFDYVAKVKFDNGSSESLKGLADFGLMMKFLSVNSMLETIRMANISMDFNIPKSMAVFSDELRNIAVGINELTNNNTWDKPVTIPEFISYAEPKRVSYFFLYTIAGHPFVENVQNIQEVSYHNRGDVLRDALSLRGMKIPILDCYRHLNLAYTGYDADMRTVMIINPEGIKVGNNESLYAVLIDDLDVNAIFDSWNGCDVTPKKEHAFADLTRACWEVVGGDQVAFIDWKKMSEQIL